MSLYVSGQLVRFTLTPEQLEVPPDIEGARRQLIN